MEKVNAAGRKITTPIYGLLHREYRHEARRNEIGAKRNGDDWQDGCGNIELSRVVRVCWAGCNYTLGSRPVEIRNYRNHSCSISMLFTRLPSLRLPISSGVGETRMELRRHLLGFFKPTMDVGDAARV